MEYQKTHEKLKSIRQLHLLDQWERLSDEQKNSLFLQIQNLDTDAFRAQINALKTSPVQTAIEPFTDFDFTGNSDDFEKGKKMISEGLVGCLIVAGGQGTRLGFNGPKGMIPISLVKHKSLFQLFAEKTLAAGKQAGRVLPLAIMTSPLNHLETVEYFQKNHFFGLNPNQVSFFPQGMLPFIDQKEKLFFAQEGVIAQGPDGNGSVLKKFYESRIWKHWQEMGVRYVNFVLIDNALADPYDAELIGYHERHGGDVTIKCTRRRNQNEKVGLLVKKEGKVHVVEYTEISDAERSATNSDGTLRHQCANLSLYCFSMNFIQRAAQEDAKMPLHAVLKNIKQGKEDKAWKFEKFIFDSLILAEGIRALLYPREDCFAPLKNFEGEDSILTVQHALLNADQKTFSGITEKKPPSHPFEISQEFYYPTAELIKKWKGKLLSNTEYIES